MKLGFFPRHHGRVCFDNGRNRWAGVILGRVVGIRVCDSYAGRCFEQGYGSPSHSLRSSTSTAARMHSASSTARPCSIVVAMIFTPVSLPGHGARVSL